MAAASRAAGAWAAGSTRSSTPSMRCRCSCAQTANVTPSRIGLVVRRERLQYALLQHLDLLLRVLQRRLAVREQFRAALVRGQRLLQWQLAAFHPADERLELGERGFETGRGFGCLGHVRATCYSTGGNRSLTRGRGAQYTSMFWRRGLIKTHEFSVLRDLFARST